MHVIYDLHRINMKHGQNKHVHMRALMYMYHIKAIQ